MHDPKVEKAASEYLRRVDTSPTQPWKRSEVQRHLVAFAEEQRREVRAEVLAPREASPELEGSECRLRLLATGNVNRFDEEEAKAIAAELDRLRAENARLKQHARPRMPEVGETVDVRKVVSGEFWSRIVGKTCYPPARDYKFWTADGFGPHDASEELTWWRRCDDAGKGK